MCDIKGIVLQKEKDCTLIIHDITPNLIMHKAPDCFNNNSVK